jgi:hypothetical protein
VHCRQTLRWEASLWLNGRQFYLGGFKTEEEAAHAYDLAALGCKGPKAETNFPAATYTAETSTELKDLSQVWPIRYRQHCDFLGPDLPEVNGRSLLLRDARENTERDSLKTLQKVHEVRCT